MAFANIFDYYPIKTNHTKLIEHPVFNLYQAKETQTKYNRNKTNERSFLSNFYRFSAIFRSKFVRVNLLLRDLFLFFANHLLSF